MALINPSNLYSGGNVQLNSTPYLNYYLKQDAEKKAKEEALNKYFGQKLANVTATGVRQEEAQTLGQIKNDISNYFAQNKEAILNTGKDNGKAWGELQRKFNQAEQVINTGKIRNEENKSIQKILSNPNVVNLIDLDTLSEAKQKHDQSSYIYKDGELVDNPNFKKFDLADITFHPKEMNEADWTNYLQGFRKLYQPDQYKVDYAPTGNNKFQLSKQEITSYSPKRLKQMGEKAINDFNSSKRVAYSFKLGHDLLKGNIEDYKEENEAKFNELNTIFKNVMERDIENPADIHAAEIIKLNLGDFLKGGTQTNIDELEKSKMRRMEYMVRHRGSQDDAFYDAYADTVNLLKGFPTQKVPLTSLPSNLIKIYLSAAEKTLDRPTLNMFNRKPDNYEISADPNGDGILVYKVGENVAKGKIPSIQINTEANAPYGTKVKIKSVPSQKQQQAPKTKKLSW